MRNTSWPRGGRFGAELLQRSEVKARFASWIDGNEKTMRPCCQYFGGRRSQIRPAVAEHVLIRNPQLAALHPSILWTNGARFLGLEALADSRLTKAYGDGVLSPHAAAALAPKVVPLDMTS